MWTKAGQEYAKIAMGQWMKKERKWWGSLDGYRVWLNATLGSYNYFGGLASWRLFRGLQSKGFSLWLKKILGLY